MSIVILFCYLYTLNLNEGYAADSKDGPAGFGKYLIDVLKLEKCSSAEPIHETLFNNYNVTIKQLDKKEQEIEGFIYVIEDFQMKSVSYFAEVWKNGGYKKILNKHVVNPCKDPILRFLLKTAFHPDPNCFIKKGNYSISKVNANSMTHKIFGNNFFFSKVRTKFEFYSQKGVLLCLICDTECKPDVYSQSKKTKT